MSAVRSRSRAALVGAVALVPRAALVVAAAVVPRAAVVAAAAITFVPRAAVFAATLTALVLSGCDDPAAGESRRCPSASGYADDEVCVEPPAPGTGFQLHYGPASYDDPDEVARYVLAPGEERTDCVFMKTPNDSEVFISGYRGRMRAGSHHMITYVQDREIPDSDGPEPCEQGVDSTFLLGSQETAIDLTLDQAAPEELGDAMRLGARRQVAIQLHYLNSTDAPILREAWINVLYAEPETVTREVSSLFWLGGLGMNVLPGVRETIRAACEVPANAPPDLALTRITGHFHAHTLRQTVWKVSGATRTRLYEGYDYNHPGWFAFNTEADNPSPNANGKIAGSDHDGPLTLAPGDRLEWECDVHNTTNAPLQFADGVFTAEMCNVFGTYAPSMGGAWRCLNF
jgi:hypothetical protein